MHPLQGSTPSLTTSSYTHTHKASENFTYGFPGATSIPVYSPKHTFDPKTAIWLC